MNAKHIITVLSFALGSNTASADTLVGHSMKPETASHVQVEERSVLTRRGTRGFKLRNASMTKEFNQVFMLAGLTDYSGGSYIRRGQRGVKHSAEALALMNFLMADSGQYGQFPGGNDTPLIRRGTRN